MATIDQCPHCNSFLLIRHGSPSPLDGKRQFLCLGCGVELPPRRSRALCVLTIVLGSIFGPFFLVLGVWLVWDWVYRYMVMPFLGAGACLVAVVLSWRALRATTPVPVDTTIYPNASVSLESCGASADGIVAARPDWAKSLREFAAGVIKAAGDSLANGKSSCTVWVAAECNKEGIRYADRYRGTPDEVALGQLSAEIDKLPTFGIPDGTVKLTLSFRVRA